MNLQGTISVLLLFITAIGAYLAALWFSQQKQIRGAGWGALVIASSGFWVTFQALAALYPEYTFAYACQIGEFIAALIGGYAYPIFTLQFSGKKERTQPRHLLVQAVPPLLILTLLLTNPYHHLLIREYLYQPQYPLNNIDYLPGPLFWLAILYFVYNLTRGGITLWLGTRQLAEAYRTQVLAILILSATPLTITLINTALNVFPAFEPDGTAYAIGAIITALRLPVLRKMDIRHHTIHQAIHLFREPFFLLDPENNIIDLNNAALALLDKTRTDVIGESLQLVYPELFAQIHPGIRGESVPKAVYLQIGDQIAEFTAEITTALDLSGDVVSRTVILNFNHQGSPAGINMQSLIVQLRNYQHITEALLSTTSLPDVMQRVTDAIVDNFGFQSAFIAQYDPKYNQLHGLAFSPHYEPQLKNRIRTLLLPFIKLPDNLNQLHLPLNPGNSPTIDAVIAGQQVTSQHLCDLLEGWFPEQICNLLENLLGIATAGCLPLRSGDRTYGLLFVTCQQPFISPGRQKALKRIADLAAVAIENTHLKESLEQKLHEQVTVTKAMDAIYSTLEHSAVFYQLAEQFVHALNLTSGYICTYDPETRASTVVAEYISDQANELERLSDLGQTYILDEDDSYIQSLQPSVYYADDPDLTEEERQHLKEYGANSVLIVPIRIRDTIKAYAELWDSRNHREFTEEEIRLAQAIARHAALALDNASLFQEAQQRAREQSMVRNILAELVSTLDYDTIIRLGAEKILQALQATSAYICIFDSKTRRSTVIAEAYSPEAAPQERISDLGTSYIEDDVRFNHFMETGIPIVEHYDDPQLSEDMRQHMLTYGGRTVLYLPLRIRHGLIGFIEIWESRHKRDFSPQEINLGQTIAQQIALAMDNALLYRQAQEEIAERKRIEAALRQSEQDYRGLFENAHDAIIIFKPEGEIVLDVNQRACELYQIPRHEFIGSSLEAISTDMERGRFHIQKTLEAGSHHNFETTQKRRDGTIMHIEVNASLIEYQGERAILSINRDITERKQFEAQLVYDALHDALTGLPNRTLFLDHLKRAITRLKREPGYIFAVLFMDLDDFKNINDTLGHNVGDEYLKEIAQRLKNSLRLLDTVARFGGDEFVILLENLDHVDDIYDIINRIQQTISRPYIWSGQTLATTASIGIVIGDRRYQEPDDILRDADIAMYRAKAKGGGTFEFFDEKMRNQFVKMLNRETELRQAIEQEQFTLVYQAIYSQPDMPPSAFEAFLRWKHPKNGLVSPVEFLETAEESGTILQLGDIVLDIVLAQIRQWRDNRVWPENCRVFINLSPKQLSLPSVIEHIQERLAAYHLPPDVLGVEIPENAVVQHYERSQNIIKQLSEMGIALHLDDFGKGLSSLSLLHTLPVKAMKIDHVFIHNLNTPKINRMVKSFVTIGHDLDLYVMAKGIETKNQLETLIQYDCDFYQGYHLHRPQLGEEILSTFLQPSKQTEKDTP